MKSIIQFFSLLSVLILFSVSCFATSSININEQILKKYEINAPIRVTADLISATPCMDDDGNIQGFSATIRVNVFATFGETELLVASQTVNVPCGTIVTNNMTRPDFDGIATQVGSEGVSLVTDYLDENDENGAILKELAVVLTDTMNSIEE